jgi:predicted protein tyrosine phosphatase
MEKLKILIICSRNKKRSLTAEKIYQNDQRLEIRSVGTSPKAKRKIKESDIKWAEIILCMEKKHYKMIQKLFGINNLPNTLVLGIEDEYEFMDPELINMLKTEIEVILQR